MTDERELLVEALGGNGSFVRVRVMGRELVSTNPCKRGVRVLSGEAPTEVGVAIAKVAGEVKAQTFAEKRGVHGSLWDLDKGCRGDLGRAQHCRAVSSPNRFGCIEATSISDRDERVLEECPP